MRRSPWLWVLLLLLGSQAGAQEFVDRALQAKREGRLEEARHILLEGLKEEPRSAMGHYVLAWVLALRGDRQNAREEFQLALDLGLEGPPAEEARQAIQRLGNAPAASPKPAKRPAPKVRPLGDAEYVHKEGSRIYHLLGCRWMLMTPRRLWVPLTSDTRAEARGMKPCYECMAWKRPEGEVAMVAIAPTVGAPGAGVMGAPGMMAAPEMMGSPPMMGTAPMAPPAGAMMGPVESEMGMMGPPGMMGGPGMSGGPPGVMTAPGASF